MPKDKTLTTSDIAKAVSNTGYGTFEIGDRTFEIRDLDYDSYVEFCDLARPIISAVASGFDITQTNGEVGLNFSPMSLDFSAIMKSCANELPRMAWLCCRQADPKITEGTVKNLARRPHILLEVILMQIKQNNIIAEFQDFFPRLATLLTDLAPQATAAMGSVPVNQSTTTTV